MSLRPIMTIRVSASANQHRDFGCARSNKIILIFLALGTLGAVRAFMFEVQRRKARYWEMRYCLDLRLNFVCNGSPE